MTNRVTLIGRVVDEPKVRKFESRKAGGEIEIVSLWLSVPSGERFDRFTVEINCPRAQKVAKAMGPDVMVEVQGELRHDRWKAKDSDRWVGKVYVAVDPGRGTLRSKGKAVAAEAAEAA